MNSERCQLVHWGLSAPPFGFMPGWCSEERPPGTADQSVPTDPQGLFGIFVFLRTLGWQPRLALPLHVTRSSEAAASCPWQFPWLCSSLSMEKERNDTCLSVSQETRTGEHALQVLPNCWPGWEGRRHRQSWNYELALTKETMKVRDAKHTADTGDMEVVADKDWAWGCSKKSLIHYFHFFAHQMQTKTPSFSFSHAGMTKEIFDKYVPIHIKIKFMLEFLS